MEEDTKPAIRRRQRRIDFLKRELKCGNPRTQMEADYETEVESEISASEYEIKLLQEIEHLQLQKKKLFVKIDRLRDVIAPLKEKAREIDEDIFRLQKKVSKNE